MATHYPRQKEPSNIHQALKKKICEICGDIGLQEAIITCYQCKNVDVHQSCVLGYCDDAPEDWCCQKCAIGKGVISSSRGLENEYSEGSKLHASAKICERTVQPKKHMKFAGGHCTNWEKKVETGKTRYIPVEQALDLFKKTAGSSRVVSTKSTVTVTRRNFSKPRTSFSNSYLEKSTEQHSSGSAGYTKPQNLQNSIITGPSKKQVQSSKG
ncbi:hypothetical protein HAX54_012590 [Datura stramonium]|uniref:PHD-type domain-containing protein n=1 Tax=Datura stramonium TaxID=4076 RepID=A0ABS8TMW3_DATST|nr:hypothetical protein [Datura stramonium]